jgi:hypothetical protein
VHKSSRKAPAPIRRCKCPLGTILGDCPFSYANGWHARRAEMLLRSEITPRVAASINKERRKRARDPVLTEQLETPDFL